MQQPYDPLSIWRAMADHAASVTPDALLKVQADGLREWSDFWLSAWGATETAPVRDRRFAAKAWSEDPYYRTLRDAYLLASKQAKAAATLGTGKDAAGSAMVGFVLDQFLNALSPANFAATNPDVVARTMETGGQNLLQGFGNLVADVVEGKGIVRRRPDKQFVRGETIAATPGEVVFQNDLFQLIQYTPTTADVAATPLLYVPPLVNKFYMIDLQPKSSLVKWLVDQGRTVFVVSWVNPDARHRDAGVEAYVLGGIVEAIGAARAAAKAERVDLFAFCLGGTLVSLALAWLQAKGRAGEVASATLIGSMVDFADMRDWSAFVNEAHLDALDAHLAKRGYIESTELQQLFAAVRANDLIWSSVIQHYLLDKPAPASDLLYWFEDGARIPQEFLRSYNRDLLFANALRHPNGFQVGGVAIDLATVTTPILLLALKDDHVSAWEAVYSGAALFGGPVTFVLGGSGHNAGVINPPAANKHGFWTRQGDRPADAADWLAGATKNEGSWWPWWTGWLDATSGTDRVPARAIENGLEPAPGSYVAVTH